MAVPSGPSTEWLYSQDELENTPSRRTGVDSDRELSYRQNAANLIQDMGQRLSVSQLIINTAIVYMHRFYMIHSFTKFHRNIISQATLFLAAKVEEQPRKLEHVIRVAHACIHPQEAPIDTKSHAYLQQAQELVVLETLVLETLGFEITVEHPHMHVVRCTQLVRASKDLAQTSYFLATNSLQLTTFCLQHKPAVIACVCIHLACKWSNGEIPVSTDGKHWWEYLDCTVSLQLLEELTHKFLQILDNWPTRLKRLRNWRAPQAAKKPKTEQAVESPVMSTSSLDGLPGVNNSSDSKNQQFGGNPLLSAEPQKVLTLQKYREKQAAELALPSRRMEGQGANILVPPLALPSSSSHNHKKRSHSQTASQPGDRCREKSVSKKPCMPPSFMENGSASISGGLQMMTKVSSSKHHSGPEKTAPKDKHKEHSGHTKHGHSHPYPMGGSGRGVTDPAASLRSAKGNGSYTGSSGSSRKRPHPDGHDQHSKRSHSSNGLATHCVPGGGQRTVVEHHYDHVGTNRVPNPSSLYINYLDTFDMLDSLLCAQGINL